MKLVEFKEQNTIIAKDQLEYLPMPAHVSGEHTICCWQLSWKERFKLLLTGRMWHWIKNFRQPIQPQLLTLDNPFQK